MWMVTPSCKPAGDDIKGDDINCRGDQIEASNDEDMAVDEEENELSKSM